MDDERTPLFKTAVEALAKQRGVPVQQVLDENKAAALNIPHVCYLDSCNEERICQYPSTCLLKVRHK